MIYAVLEKYLLINRQFLHVILWKRALQKQLLPLRSREISNASSLLISILWWEFYLALSFFRNSFLWAHVFSPNFCVTPHFSGAVSEFQAIRRNLIYCMKLSAWWQRVFFIVVKTRIFWCCFLCFTLLLFLIHLFQLWICVGFFSDRYYDFSSGK